MQYREKRWEGILHTGGEKHPKECKQEHAGTTFRKSQKGGGKKDVSRPLPATGRPASFIMSTRGESKHLTGSSRNAFTESPPHSQGGVSHF